MAGPPPRRNPFGPGGSLAGTTDGRHGGLRGSPVAYTRGDSMIGTRSSPAPSDSSSEGGRITVTIKELQGEYHEGEKMGRGELKRRLRWAVH